MAGSEPAAPRTWPSADLLISVLVTRRTRRNQMPELRDLVSGTPPAGRLARDSSALCTFAEGVVMLVLGVLALIFPVLASGPPV